MFAYNKHRDFPVNYKYKAELAASGVHLHLKSNPDFVQDAQTTVCLLLMDMLQEVGYKSGTIILLVHR